MSGKSRKVWNGMAVVAAVLILYIENESDDAPADTSGTDQASSGTASETTTATTPARVVDVPDVAGKPLAPAYDDITEAGFTDILVMPVDEHIIAVDYTNWRIVGQSPTGETSTDSEIRLEVVKTDEAESRFCFDDDC